MRSIAGWYSAGSEMGRRLGELLTKSLAAKDSNPLWEILKPNLDFRR